MLRTPTRGKARATQMLKPLATFLSALADENRLYILTLIAERGEMTVCTLCKELQQSQPAISHHLQLLRTARLIHYRREGKFNYYSLDDNGIEHILKVFTEDGKLDLANVVVTFQKR